MFSVQVRPEKIDRIGDARRRIVGEITLVLSGGEILRKYWVA